jgi:hypothetical protein
MVACNDGDEVVSLNSPSANESEKASVAMALCLERGGVAAEGDAGPEGNSVVLTTDEPYRICTESGLCESSGGAWSGDMTEDDWLELSATFDGMAQRYLDTADGAVDLLFIGQNDFSELYRQCRSESGYETPQLPGAEADELSYKTKIAEAGLKWARCARENGYPEVRDPDPPVADGYNTIPAAVAPFSMSPDQLRNLLTVCPNIDIDGHRSQEESMANPSLSGDAMPEVYDPIVTFDFPGWNGSVVDGDDLDEATLGKLTAFQAVLDEAGEAALGHVAASRK